MIGDRSRSLLGQADRAPRRHVFAFSGPHPRSNRWRETSRWLAGAELHIVDSCFKASHDKPAVVSANETSSEVTVTIYGELERLVIRIANGLQEHDCRRGDTIALYMPMTLECVATYLAINRAG